MLVSELIEMLQDQPLDAEVELAVIAPVQDDNEDITVDRYSIEGMLPWTDEESDDPVIWLVGGEDDDVEAFLDWVEDDAEDSDEHEHAHEPDGESDGPAAG